jgi:RNA polymerase sigma factor (sigma-70 family)
MTRPGPAVCTQAAPGARSRRGADQENATLTSRIDEAARGRSDPAVTDLLTRAGSGDKQAWDALVERYAPLIWSICRRHGLGGADAEDVAQNVWLMLVNQLGTLRDPAALPGWLATTTRRECGRVLRAARGPHDAGRAPDAETIPDEQAVTPEQELLAAERHAALREALAQLPPCCQQLITLLLEDPPVSYAQISARLGIPVGSIGPNRGRCLDKLRRHPAIAALTGTDSESTPEMHDQAKAAVIRPANGQSAERRHPGRPSR